MSEVMIPPWVRPESPETIRLIDDATVAFQPVFGRGMTQRGIWADPRWGLHRRYRGLRSDEKAAIQNVWNESRGQFNVIRVTPHTPIRGSFPSTEVLSNNTFATGTTGWSGYQSVSTLSVSDRMLRLTLNQNNAANGIGVNNTSALTTLTQYAPYALRAMFLPGRAVTSSSLLRLGTSAGGTEFGSMTTSALGLQTLTGVPYSVAAVYLLAAAGGVTGAFAGDYFGCPYLSLARCAQVDNSPNLGLQSDTLNTTWATSNASVSANATTAPDGTNTADGVAEDTATSAHYIGQAINVSVAPAEYCYFGHFKASGRSWVQARMTTATGSVSVWFNLGTGAIGTTTTGSGWASTRAFITSVGNGWYRAHVVSRMTTADPAITIYVRVASGDGVDSYTGSSLGLFAWRVGLAQSSLPTMGGGTAASALPTGTTQSGAGLNLKGLPASTSGLLLTGDFIESAGELKQVAAPLNSDAAGLGYVQFRPTLANIPADGDPIIVNEPFGRFIYPQGTREMSNLFGIYSDCEMDLEEIYA